MYIAGGTIASTLPTKLWDATQNDNPVSLHVWYSSVHLWTCPKTPLFLNSIPLEHYSYSPAGLMFPETVPQDLLTVYFLGIASVAQTSARPRLQITSFTAHAEEFREMRSISHSDLWLYSRGVIPAPACLKGAESDFSIKLHVPRQYVPLAVLCNR